MPSARYLATGMDDALPAVADGIRELRRVLELASLKGEIYEGMSGRPKAEGTYESIRLTDHKAGSGKKRTRWLPMHPTLTDALRWWKLSRPCKVENVFMRVDQHASVGQPFTERQKLLPTLCAGAGVKQFGFHAIRHKAASIAFLAGGLKAAQQLMGHYRVTTTDIYVRSAGLYTDKHVLVDALGENEIGVAASELFTKNLMSGEPHEAFCKQKLVNIKLL